ncbi:LysR family transcriptional regulator [Alloactinosynnema sp. L-07]|uniref:LysR family transcriptional regulator n=1 Tax=Alloactinosynnema sp. L-07 TaxID=1653480 RepID=UPI0006B3FBF5|nr:LysR family transcriptional regulator [Alloactinosynnema sp. L-07]
MRLQIRHLRVICAIADSGSLNRAAGILGLGQPALSHQLRRIERLVGGELFHRDQNGVRATGLGSIVLRRAKAIVLTFDEVERDFQRRETDDGPLRVGWNDSVLAVPLLDSLRDLRPDAEVRSRGDGSRARLLAQAAHGGIDLALVTACGTRGHTTPASVRTLTLVAEPSFVALPSGHPLAERGEVALADLARENWIVPSCGDGCRVTFREMCLAHGFDAKIVHDVDEVTARENLVIGGHGVGLVQPTRPQREGMVCRQLAGSPLFVRHMIAWREGGPCADYAQEIANRVTADYWRMAQGVPHYRYWLTRNANVEVGGSPAEG